MPSFSNCFLNFQCLLLYLSKECGDFVYMWYSNQVPCVAYACKIVLGSVPNLNNYGHFSYILCLISPEKNRLILFIFGTVTRYHVLMHVISFGPMPNLINYGNSFQKCYLFGVISQRMLVLFIFGTVIDHNISLMHSKCTLALCQHVAFVSIIS